MKFVECRTLHYRVSDTDRAVKGKNWVWNSAAKREGRRERRRERWINEKRNLCTPRRPRCQCHRGPTLTKQPALFSGFLFLPFVERQRREKRFDPVSATPSSKHRSVTVGLLRDRRTGRAEGPQDGQRAGRCSVALCIERARGRTNERYCRRRRRRRSLQNWCHA